LLSPSKSASILTSFSSVLFPLHVVKRKFLASSFDEMEHAPKQKLRKRFRKKQPNKKLEGEEESGKDRRATLSRKIKELEKFLQQVSNTDKYFWNQIIRKTFRKRSSNKRRLN
jgi:hypothetical protein